MAPKRKGKGKDVQVEVDTGIGKDVQIQVDTGILDDIPNPTAIFDLSDPSKLAVNYEKYVSKIRKDMEDDSDVKFTFTVDGEKVIVPVTPGMDETSKGKYVIRLTDGSKKLDLVADKYQNWFRGIVTNSGKRFEIDDKLPKIMKGSDSLHTNGMYPMLLKGDLAELVLGYQEFLSAFHSLATHGEGKGKVNNKIEKESIAILIVMFFEGPRLLPVEEFNKELLGQLSTKKPLGVDNRELIGDWCNDSRDFYEDQKGVMEVVVSGETSDVVKKAATNLRIMCRSKWDTWVRRNSFGYRSSV